MPALKNPLNTSRQVYSSSFRKCHFLDFYLRFLVSKACQSFFKSTSKVSISFSNNFSSILFSKRNFQYYNRRIAETAKYAFWLSLELSRREDILHSLSKKYSRWNMQRSIKDSVEYVWWSFFTFTTKLRHIYPTEF